MNQQKNNANKHPYKPSLVGDSLGSLKSTEDERQAFALGYYIGRRHWDLEYDHDKTEEQIKEKDSLAYYAGYDLGSYHARQRVGNPYPKRREDYGGSFMGH